MEDSIQIMELQGSEMQILREKAAIDIQVSTAKAFPRNLKRCIDNALTTATIDAETAATCSYSVPRAGKVITGPTVHLAKIIMQTWGNFRGEAKVIDESARTLTSEAVAWDLENNVAVKVTVKRSIMTKTGRMTEDMIIVTGNAANSIALRNAIFAVIPKAVTDKVYTAAQKKIIGGDPESGKKWLTLLLKTFKDKYNKEESDVLGLVGKTDSSQITDDDLVVLIGIGQALKDGDTTIEIVFKEKKEPVKPEEKESERMALLINDAKTPEDLAVLQPHVKPELLDLFNTKMDELKSVPA